MCILIPEDNLYSQFSLSVFTMGPDQAPVASALLVFQIGLES